MLERKGGWRICEIYFAPNVGRYGMLFLKHYQFLNLLYLAILWVTILCFAILLGSIVLYFESDIGDRVLSIDHHSRADDTEGHNLGKAVSHIWNIFSTLSKILLLLNESYSCCVEIFFSFCVLTLFQLCGNPIAVERKSSSLELTV